MPTLKAIWAPKGQQVMIETPAQPSKRCGIGAVNYHTGETVVLIRRKRRREIAELLEALLAYDVGMKGMWLPQSKALALRLGRLPDAVEFSPEKGAGFPLSRPNRPLFLCLDNGADR